MNTSSSFAQPPTGQVHSPSSQGAEPSGDVGLLELVSALTPHWKRIVAATLGAGAIGYGVAMLLPPIYTARASFITPQQQQSSAASALASLGALSNLAGAAGGLKTPSDQYLALMQSVTVSDRIIKRFDLRTIYAAKFQVDARKQLVANVKMTAGKKDSVIVVEVDDKDPQRAADIANAYIDELRTLSNSLALTEAQQRRAFFEQQLTGTKAALIKAQGNLQKAGFNAGALKSEPKAAAEAYARTKAELAVSEVKLNALRRSMTDSATEIQQLLAAIGGLRQQLSQLEQPLPQGGNEDYVGAYREYKYQEALFEIFSRQFELAKMDEAREGALIQVLDTALPPERRSKPKRSLIAAGAAIAGLVLACGVILLRRRRAAAPH